MFVVLRRACCFTLIVFLLSRGCLCSVPLLRVGLWSVIVAFYSRTHLFLWGFLSKMIDSFALFIKCPHQNPMPTPSV